MIIGENIKKIRLLKGLTQKELGALCVPPIAESTIRKYELGKLNPKFETMQKIAKALKVPANYLVTNLSYYDDCSLYADALNPTSKNIGIDDIIEFACSRTIHTRTGIVLQKLGSAIETVDNENTITLNVPEKTILLSVEEYKKLTNDILFSIETLLNTLYSSKSEYRPPQRIKLTDNDNELPFK